MPLRGIDGSLVPKPELERDGVCNSVPKVSFDLQGFTINVRAGLQNPSGRSLRSV